MNDPYRTATPKEDIVNTRIDALEKRMGSTTSYILGLIIAVVVLFGTLFGTTIHFRGQRLQGACHSQVKTHSKADMAASSIVCDHPDQDMHYIVTDRELVISCTCHGERQEK